MILLSTQVLLIGGGGPTDPLGAVGPNHYVIISNAGFRIYNKLGNPATNWLDYSAIFDGDNLCCDPTVSYDHDANRFVMTVLAYDGVHIAVSGGQTHLAAGMYMNMTRTQTIKNYLFGEMDTISQPTNLVALRYMQLIKRL